MFPLINVDCDLLRSPIYNKLFRMHGILFRQNPLWNSPALSLISFPPIHVYPRERATLKALDDSQNLFLGCFQLAEALFNKSLNMSIYFRWCLLRLNNDIALEIESNFHSCGCVWGLAYHVLVPLGHLVITILGLIIIMTKTGHPIWSEKFITDTHSPAISMNRFARFTKSAEFHHRRKRRT